MKTPARLAALALAFALQACAGKQEKPAAAATPVVVAPAEVGELEERIEGTGELAAPDRAVIAAELDGRVTAVNVDEGIHVEAGAVLLEIDPEKRRLDADAASAQLRDAEAAVAVAKREYDRANAMHDQGVASDSLLDQRQTELARAQARVDASNAQRGVAARALRDASVRAPFAGLVARRDVSRGDYVRPGQALLEVVALDPIEVEFSVAERDSARVAMGQPVRVTVAPYPDEAFTGSVSAVSPVIDPKTRTLRVKARIPNTDGRLRPGLFARTDLGVAKRSNVVFVPSEAILERADGEVVFVVGDDDRVRRVKVKTGVERDGKLEIAAGVGPEDVVVTRGHTDLADGALVSRRQPDGKPATSSMNVASEQASTGSAR